MLFLVAYWCSGFAGLIYEVCWTRLLTLYLGHSTAAASAVVAAFLGGLAAGAAVIGWFAPSLARRQSLNAYLGLEIGVALAALALPFEIHALVPLLRFAYTDGDGGLTFAAIRLLICLLLVFVPAAALGATFPLAIRWYATDVEKPARHASLLYAVNTTGAAVGSLSAGFFLIPWLGLSATTLVGIAGSTVAAVSVLALIVRHGSTAEAAPVPDSAARTKPVKLRREKSTPTPAVAPSAPMWLAAMVLGLSGFAALVHEIAWTRILALVLGPTIYAFSATVAAVVAGVAIGSFAGSWIAARFRNHLTWLIVVLTGAALSNAWTATLAGTTVPDRVAHYMATSSVAFDQLLRQGTLLTAALILPTAFCFGAAFPLALAAIRTSTRAATDFAAVYAVNAIGAVAGSLLCGFVFIPRFGLHGTLAIVTGCIVAAALVIALAGQLTPLTRLVGSVAPLAAVLLLLFGPSWDRTLLASGAYLYAPYVPKELDLDTQLRAGTLLYDRDGAVATVSVKRLTGTTTLAVDGKVDASNRSDMLTQKLVAHVPLLLHDNPHNVAVIGLGSGVTVGAALRHPISRLDVVELSPEVVEASHFFDTENHSAIKDPRTHLIVGDGRSHVLLSSRQYDVIVSEPSNPWIAGVAALFTRDFFEAARGRLAPGGIICQWAHTYNIAENDLRAIVATFSSVFPNGTLWMIGGDDVLLVASNGDRDDIQHRLVNVDRNWHRPGVADDLALVAAVEPFSISSLLSGGPAQLERFGAGAAIITDDRMSLEFSAPRALHSSSAEENDLALASLQNPRSGDSPRSEMANSHDANAAEHWQRRAGMLFKADAYSSAYRDYLKALSLDFHDKPALEGFVKSAVLAGRATEAIEWLKQQGATRPLAASQLVAMSKLQASNSLGADALDTAKQAVRLFPGESDAVEQLASVAADEGDVSQLDEAVGRLKSLAPDRAPTLYFTAAAALIRGQVDETVRLAERAIAVDPSYAPVYDLVGAAYTKLDRPADAKKAFEMSLRFDAHDSTAYTNLGLLELAAGNRPAAANYFAEALGLSPASEIAREGLARAR